MPLPSDAAAPPDRSEARALLTSLQDIELERYAIVGSCLRFDGRSRNQLKVFRQRLAESFYSRSTAPRNFLLWGAPGSGKSYLIQQIAKSLPPEVRYVELNLAQQDQQSLRSGLEDFMATPGPGLCFIDECDALPDQSWPYEVLLPYLEPPVPRRYPTGFVLAGSGGTDLEEFTQRIRSRPKGVDLLSRIPKGNEFIVGPLGAGDKILVSIVQLLLAAREEGHAVKEIEKLALYYLAVHPAFTSARQLRSRATQCAQRIPPAEETIRYDYLFRAGDPENKRFWTESESVRDGLEEVFVRVGPGSLLSTARAPTADTRAAPRAPASEVPSYPRLAVLPLANISPDPDDGYFADGLTDELISQVSKISNLRVIARTSVVQYKGSTKPLKEVARELDIKLALEGSVRKSGNQLRITAQLVDTASEEQLWSSRYDRPLTDIFAIQDDIASHIASSVAAHLSGPHPETRFLIASAPGETSDMEAYSLFLHGRQLLGEKGSLESIRAAVGLFERAVAREPNFARARVGVAEALLWLATEGSIHFHDAEDRAYQELRRALALNDGIAEAHSVLAALYLGTDRYVECEREARRAMELNPSLADPYRWLAQLAAGRGDIHEAIRLLEAARQLNPDDVNVLSFYGRALAYAGREVEALAFWKATKSRIRFRTNAHMCEYYLVKGDLAKAEESVREMERVRPGSPWALLYRGLLAVRQGDPATARRLIGQLEERAKQGEMVVFFIGFLHFGLGEMDEFVASMEEAQHHRVLPLLELLYSPLFAAARADPRIQEVLRRQHELENAPPPKDPA